MRKFIFIIMILVAFVGVQCQSHSQSTSKTMKQRKGVTMELKSPAFNDGGLIPARYTCDGENISPSLKWGNVPSGVKSFALIADDPDAPMGTWVHWVIFNIPDTVSALPEAVPAVSNLENGAVQGKNDFRKIGYGGPCPPSGVHRYFFKLYALDSKLNLAPGATKAELLRAMEGHILAKAQLIGRYSRQK